MAGKGDQLAIVQADAFSINVVDPAEIQLAMVGGGATSIIPVVIFSAILLQFACPFIFRSCPHTFC